MGMGVGVGMGMMVVGTDLVPGNWCLDICMVWNEDLERAIEVLGAFTFR